MSAFDPVDVTLGNSRRKILQQRLAAVSGGPVSAAPSAAGGAARPFGGFRGIPGIGLTHASTIAPGLQKLLGPGGYGTPSANEQSAAPGMPAIGYVVPNHGLGRTGHPPPPSGGPPSLPPVGQGGNPVAGGSGPVALPPPPSGGGFTSTATSAASNPALVSTGSGAYSNLDQNTGGVASAVGSSLSGAGAALGSSLSVGPIGLIPLGGGAYYDPSTDRIHGAML